MRVLLTGPPGVGKTTLVGRVVERWEARGKPVRGFLTREVREAGRRVGFELEILPERVRFWLAHVRPIGSVRMGRYTLSFGGLQMALQRLRPPYREDELVVVDEIGPMELMHPPFARWIRTWRDLPPRMLVTFQARRRAMLARWGVLAWGKVLEVTPSNRDALVDVVLALLEGRAS